MAYVLSLFLYMFIKIFTFLSIHLSYKNNSSNSNPNKKPNNKYKILLKKIFNYLKNRIFSKKTIISFFIIFFTGLFFRFIINNFLLIDVFKDYFNIISLLYYGFMSLFSVITKLIVNDILNDSMVLMMNGGNDLGRGWLPINSSSYVPVPGSSSSTADNSTLPVSGSSSSSTANSSIAGNPVASNPSVSTVGNPPMDNNPITNPQHFRAGKINGPIQVNDPLNQNYIYDQYGTNQPLLGNIARSLDYQKSIGLHSLSRFTFNSDQEKYILSFLLFNHKDVYDKIVIRPGNSTNNEIVAQWGNQTNTKAFRDLLRNAR